MLESKYTIRRSSPITILISILIAGSFDPYHANIIWYSKWLQTEHRTEC